MKVTFEPAASDELDRIVAWIARDHPRAALNMIARIEDKVMRLESPELTHMGAPVLLKARASFSNGHISIIVYKVYEDREEVVIVSIVHGAQDREGAGS